MTEVMATIALFLGRDPNFSLYLASIGSIPSNLRKFVGFGFIPESIIRQDLACDRAPLIYKVWGLLSIRKLRSQTNSERNTSRCPGRLSAFLRKTGPAEEYYRRNF